MKISLLIGFFIALSNLCLAQQSKQNIDYQYYRDANTYYAFELFKNTSAADDNLMLNFVSNSNYKKIEKIYLKQGTVEFKLKFKVRVDTVNSDNPELKFYPISFILKDLDEKNICCDAQIVFKLDNSSVLTLPFSICAALAR